MSDDEAMQRRLRAVERSLTEGDHDVDALRDVGTLTDRIEELESRLADAEDRIAELEASTQALRGYVGNVRSVNEDVERRADAALAAVERLEDRLDDTARTTAARRDSSTAAGSSGRGTSGRRTADSSRDCRPAVNEFETNDDGGAVGSGGTSDGIDVEAGDGDATDAGDGDVGDGGDGDEVGLVARVRRVL